MYLPACPALAVVAVLAWGAAAWLPNSAADEPSTDHQRLGEHHFLHHRNRTEDLTRLDAHRKRRYSNDDDGSDVFMQDDDPNDSMPVALPWVQSGSASVSTEPSFVVGEWNTCSASCGEGVRERSVECKILLEFSRTVAKLPDSECPGQKPPSISRCYSRPCSDSKLKNPLTEEQINSNKIHLRSNKLPNSLPAESRALSSRKENQNSYAGFAWRTSGFTECSATCLGGTQESIINCVRTKDERVVSPYLCDINDRPDSMTRTCNDIPCPPRWTTAEFSACSKPCGSGIQTRQVQCIHEVTRGPENTMVVPSDQCPQPAPKTTQRCNIQDCPPRWDAGVWGKCSRHCGGGIKTRAIKCVRELTLGQVVEVPASLCPRKQPQLRKVCNRRACPDVQKERQHRLIIPADNNIYVQKVPLRRLSIKVGGKAIVFAGTTLKIRCPRRKAANKTLAVEWFKDNEKISYDIKHQLTARQALRVKKVDYQDAGKYTCSVGSSEASILISVKAAPIATPSTTEYSLLPFEDPTQPARHAHHQHHHRTTGSSSPVSGGNRSHNRVSWESAHRDNPISEQNKVASRDESKDLSTSPLRTSETHKFSRDKSPTTSSTTPPSLVAWEVRVRQSPIVEKATRGAFFADQRKPDRANDGESLAAAKATIPLDDSTAHLPVTSPSFFYSSSTSPPSFGNFGEDARSGASQHRAPMSQLQKLLSSLKHSFQDSNADDEQPRSPSAPKIGVLNHAFPYHHDPLALTSDNEADVESAPRTVILGKGKAENLQFDWITSSWSPCSESCGATGFQVRGTQCVVRFHNVTKPVDQNLCFDAGLSPPTHIQDCETDDCPKWFINSWHECSECVGESTAIQRREVKCILSNGTELELSQCNNATKPTDHRECVNQDCKGVWAPGSWTECRGKCGEEGFQSRILQCVWSGGQTPSRVSAGKACEDMPRPLVMRTCNLSCPSEDCSDRSKHCGLARALNMCRLSHYRKECCRSCSGESYNSIE